MFSAVLRNFYHAIASINYVLPYAFHFVAEHKGIFFPFFKNKLSEFMAVLGLLHRQRFITRLFKSEDCLQRVGCIFPRHGIFGTQSRLMDFGRGRTGCDAAKHNLLYTESIGRAKNRTHIVQAPHIVEHNDKGLFRRTPELVHRKAVHLFYGKFLIFHTAKLKI